MKKYTLEEIRLAFRKTFHNSGELWFSGKEGDFCGEWEEFIRFLNVPNNERICGNCGEKIDLENWICNDCFEEYKK